ncbi:hypothetical protein VNO77_31678 [Canavalia gladiata]|uniref:Secreted protein n=1 Tax=Canavalia gladiata TaxID=3824 RepID=A0AAN9KPV0_CANGL
MGSGFALLYIYSLSTVHALTSSLRSPFTNKRWFSIYPWYESNTWYIIHHITGVRDDRRPLPHNLRSWLGGVGPRQRLWYCWEYPLDHHRGVSTRPSSNRRLGCGVSVVFTVDKGVSIPMITFKGNHERDHLQRKNHFLHHVHSTCTLYA